MIKILNAEPANYSNEAYCVLQSIGEIHAQELTRDELRNQLSEFDVLIIRLGFQIDKEIIDTGRRLKAIVTATTGLDHIDVNYAEERGIAVLSLRGETDFLRSIPATAEHTWALLLALVRRIPWAFDAVRGGLWERDAFKGHDLAGKRLGIVGLGRIGEKVACYGIAFGMQVGAFDPYRRDWQEGVTCFENLREVVKWCDVLSLHVPLNDETKELIGVEQLGWLPSHAYLINTSRGAVVDEPALVWALENSELAGAALDVVSSETSQDRNAIDILINYADHHDNLLITPHIGGATIDSMHATEVFMAEKLKDFLRGKPGK